MHVEPASRHTRAPKTPLSPKAPPQTPTPIACAVRAQNLHDARAEAQQAHPEPKGTIPYAVAPGVAQMLPQIERRSQGEDGDPEPVKVSYTPPRAAYVVPPHVMKMLPQIEMWASQDDDASERAKHYASRAHDVRRARKGQACAATCAESQPPEVIHAHP